MEVDVKKLLFILLVFTLACSEDSNPVGGWEGDFNDSGFPIVSGTYSFTTQTIHGSCSDGSSGDDEPVSFNIIVTQYQNNITLTQPASNSTSVGITILEASPMQGTIDKDCSFIANQSMTATLDGFEGNVSLNYHISGTFTTSGWSGNYSFSLYLHYYNATCNYSTIFSGSKISSECNKGVIPQMWSVVN